MDENIEKIKHVANRNKYYQILIIFVSFLCWVTTNCQQSTYGYFELMPMVNYTVIENGKPVIKKGKLSRKICKNYPYKVTEELESTWTESFDIYCDQAKKGLIATIGNTGNLIGTIILPFFVNAWGVKITMLVSGYFFSASIALCIAYDNYWYTVFMGAFFNMWGSTLSYLSYILTLEVTVDWMRSFGAGVTNSGFNVGAVGMMLLLKYLNSWRIPFLYAGGLNLLLTIIIHIFSYESPLIFLRKNDVKGFILTLEKIARFNKCHDEFNNCILYHFHEHINSGPNQIQVNETTEEYRECCEEFIKYYAAAAEIQAKEKKYTIIDVLKYPSHRYLFFILNWVWFASNYIYSSISVDIKNIPGDAYTNGFIINPIELVVFVSTGFLMNVKWIGRRGLLLGASILSVVSNIILIFVSSLPGTGQMIFSLIVRETNASITCNLYTYSAELYSTKLMNSALAWNIIIGQVGPMISPIPIEYLHQTGLNILFACLTIPSVICLMVLKETLGRPIITEIEEERVIVEDFTERNSETSKILADNLIHKFDEINDEDGNKI